MAPLLHSASQQPSSSGSIYCPGNVSEVRAAELLADEMRKAWHVIAHNNQKGAKCV
jgi:hypothetical protein